MQKNSPMVALALFVKDEFSDVVGWIAWHAALGVKTFFIYDDHSSDGTWEILQAAARCLDIRLKRTDPIGEPDFYYRQRDSFLEAAREANGHFDWLGFLDGDEYVCLKQNDSLPDFLRNFDHADAIAFSWRIHGSSSRVVRPKRTTVEIFTQHSTDKMGENGHVKSFVRPDKLGRKYNTPHWFDVEAERYARPSGKLVEYASPIQEIEWSHAFVMHYICRSMEHYIQRIKRRLNADLKDSSGYWNHYDRNDLTDSEPLALMPRVNRYIAPIVDEMVKSAVLGLRSTVLKKEDSSEKTKEQASVGVAPTLSVFRIKSFFATYLYYSPEEARVVHANEMSAARRGLQEIVGSVDPATPDLITFFVAGQNNVFIQFPDDSRIMKTVFYLLKPQAGGRFAFMIPGGDKYLAFLPPKEGIGSIEINRHQPGDWEHTSFEPTETSSLDTLVSSLSFNPGHDTKIGDVLGWVCGAPSVPSNEALLRVLHLVSPSVRAEISRYVPGLLWNVTP